MVTAAWLSVLLATAADPPGDDASVRASLASGRYPWYDSSKDALTPIILPREITWLPSLPAWMGLGTLLVVLVMVVALIALVALLVWSFWNAAPPELSRVATRHRPGSASRVDALPPGLDLGVGDLWAEAVRRRSIGDLSGSILCVFVHQLLALEKRGLLRLAPGKTARQLVRSIGRAEIRSKVEPTLRLFEVAFYGHHAPDPLAFEAAWAEAEALERLLAGEARA